MTNTAEFSGSFLSDVLDTVQSGVYVRRDYSGRGMYGDSCFALVFEDADAVGLFLFELGSSAGRMDAEAAEMGVDPDVDEDTVRHLVSRMRQDSLGLSTVVYFPGFVLDGEVVGYEDEN